MTAETTAHNSYYLHSHSLNENIWYIYTPKRNTKNLTISVSEGMSNYKNSI